MEERLSKTVPDVEQYELHQDAEEGIGWVHGTVVAGRTPPVGALPPAAAARSCGRQDPQQFASLDLAAQNLLSKCSQCLEITACL